MEGKRTGGDLRRFGPLAVAVATVAVAFAILVDASGVEAQERRFRVADPRWDVDTWMGFYSPRGDLADVTADGIVAGLGAGYAVGPRAAWRVEGAFVNMERTGGRPALLGGARGPRAQFWHLMTGPEFELTGPGTRSWHVTFAVLGGATYQDVGEPLGNDDAGPAAGPVEAWVGTFNSHFTVGYDAFRRLRLVARAGGYVMFGEAANRESSFLGKEAAITLSAGLRFRF